LGKDSGGINVLRTLPILSGKFEKALMLRALQRPMLPEVISHLLQSLLKKSLIKAALNMFSQVHLFSFAYYSLQTAAA
ncbi:MAG: hypothetical protein IIY11_06405, partial [Clostridia bacterium]|nr:hypothetical protein [Clostridia bacterium]